MSGRNEPANAGNETAGVSSTAGRSRTQEDLAKETKATIERPPQPRTLAGVLRGLHHPLFAFFVVLYSSAQVDKRKAGKLAMAIQVAFQQMGIFDASDTKPALVSNEPMPFADVQIIENVKRLQAMNQLVSSPQGSLAGFVDHAKMDVLKKTARRRSHPADQE